MRIPKAIQNLIDSFERLPGIGPKTAQRLTFYLLHVPQIDLDSFSEAVGNLKKNTVLCRTCKNVDTMSPCQICSDSGRDHSTIMVVSEPLDVLAFERTGKYKGLYHVLHGNINPLENIGPDELYISGLLDRVRDGRGKVREIIISTNPTMEGEATSMYLTKQIKALDSQIKVSRLGMGIPTGADLEYADEMTLTQAIEGRREV